MLNLLEPFDLKSMGPQSAEALHLMIEAKKLAYEDRAKFYADPDFAQLPIATLISKPYAARRRAELKPEQANLRPDRRATPMQADTIYMTVVDRRLQLRQPDPEQLSRLRVVPRAGATWVSRSRTAVVCSRSTRTISTGSSPASDRSTRSSRASSPRTASPG